jgi:hypothetical protein
LDCTTARFLKSGSCEIYSIKKRNNSLISDCKFIVERLSNRKKASEATKVDSEADKEGTHFKFAFIRLLSLLESLYLITS